MRLASSVRDKLNIYASKGVAVREFAMPGVGEADYLLYADGKAIGVVEAKPEDWTLRGVELQSGGYMGGLPESVPAFHRPLPFGYETTGTITQFTNALEPDARSREVSAFHRPEELVRLARLKTQVRRRCGGSGGDAAARGGRLVAGPDRGDTKPR